MLGFVTSGGGDFDPVSETRLDHLELLCSKVLIKNFSALRFEKLLLQAMCYAGMRDLQRRGF